MKNLAWQHLYGVNPVIAALEAQKRIFDTLWLAEPISEKHRLVSKANEMGLNYKVVDKGVIEQYAKGKMHQGVLLKATEIQPHKVKHINELTHTGPSLWICLDHITDPQNFGSILRSAHYFKVNGVLVPSRNTSPLSSTVAKVSAGGLEWLDIYETHDLGEFITGMKKEDWAIIGSDLSESSQNLKELKKRHKMMVVFGNEGEGISKKIKKLCDEVYCIKGGSGSVDSLNVGCAAGIFLYSVY